MTAFEKITDLIIENVEFDSDAAEQAAEAAITAGGSLYRAALKFEAAGGDIEKAGSLITIAKFVGRLDDLTPEQDQEIKDAVADIFGAPSAEQQEAGNEVFRAALDTINACETMNTAVNSLDDQPADEG